MKTKTRTIRFNAKDYALAKIICKRKDDLSIQKFVNAAFKKAIADEVTKEDLELANRRVKK